MKVSVLKKDIHGGVVETDFTINIIEHEEYEHVNAAGRELIEKVDSELPEGEFDTAMEKFNEKWGERDEAIEKIDAELDAGMEEYNQTMRDINEILANVTGIPEDLEKKFRTIPEELDILHIPGTIYLYYYYTIVWKREVDMS